MKPREKQGRPYCVACERVQAACYCHLVEPFLAPICFHIVMHGHERKHPLNTARAAVRMLEGASLTVGGVGGAIDSEPAFQAVREGAPVGKSWLLFPGEGARHLDELSAEERVGMHVFVPDGTWTTARRLVRESPYLGALPRLQVAGVGEGLYRGVRKAPGEGLWSTLEAIYLLLEAWEHVSGGEGEQGRLLALMRWMVARYDALRAAHIEER